MHTRILLFSFSVLTTAAAQTPPTAPSAPSQPSAAPIQCDSFIVALLVRPADAPNLAQTELDQLGTEHIANIRRLEKEGKLLHAGPTEDYSGRNIRGVYIFRTDSLETARAWAATHPLIQRGRVKPEFFKWSVEKESLK